MESQTKHIYFRGSLKSCNYSCYYCPFAKHKMTADELKQDREALQAFYQALKEEKNASLSIMITPYGEGMIHDYYQEVMIELAALPQVKAVGIQTNLSFSVESWLDKMREAKSDFSKFRIWGSYHPSMVSPEAFASKANKLHRFMPISVGMVAVPEDLEAIGQLKKRLLPDIYLWLNGQSRRKSHYTGAQKALLKRIDPFFDYEINHIGPKSADCAAGKKSFLIEAGGKTYPCHMVNECIGKYGLQESNAKAFQCKRHFCDCFLSYSQLALKDFENFFGEDRRFRIPKKRDIQAIFFDIDGTLLDDKGQLNSEIEQSLAYLSTKCELYLATALPLAKAQQKLKKVWPYFKGGIFSNGSHIYERVQGTSRVLPLKEDLLKEPFMQQAKRKILDRDQQGNLLRVILPFKKALVYEHLEVQGLRDGNKYYIQSTAASKRKGIDFLLQDKNIPSEKVLTVGNSENDWEMLVTYGYGMQRAQASSKRLEGVTYYMEIPHIAYIVG